MNETSSSSSTPGAKVLGQLQQIIVQAEGDSGRSLDEALSEVSREMNVRIRCFPRWIEEKKMDKVEAQDRLDRLQLAQNLLQILVDTAAKQ
jgi:hypothetical protein